VPLYEYECAECGERFERLQKFSDPPIETCPQCGGHVSRLLSSPAIQFKGSGWYVTDYARAGRSDVAEKSSTEGESSKPAKSEPGAKPSKETESGTKTSRPGKK
jgi:putative FmdB family regulatory protein